MQDPSGGSTKTTEDEVKDGPSYAPSYLWRRAEKMKFAQKTSYLFRFLLVSF